MKYLLTNILLLCTFSLFAQREAAVWYFGKKAGLEFNSGRPLPLDDGQIDSLEGCASIATPDGDLLFYTNGETVWNRDHIIMNNGEGLGGNKSATQSALIVPRPDNSSIYYIFTPDAVQLYLGGNDGGGFNYSIVDMSQGSGTVTQKKIELLPFATEKVTAVIAANGIDIWVIAQREDAFYSYLLTQGGLNTTPVISNVGFGVTDFNNIRGSMKASPDATKIAVTYTLFKPDFDGRLYIYDFDNSTGMLSNEQLLGDDFVYYGVEFSSDSSKLYSSGKYLDGGDVSTLGIFQFDMLAPDIASSRYELERIATTFLSDIGGTLQLAIDKKIYWSIPSEQLSVIQKPNLRHDLARFELFEIELISGDAQFGLPPFVASFFESIFDFEFICEGDVTEFRVYDNAPIASIAWNFGDPDSDAANTSTALNPDHVFTAPGPYVVSAVVNFSNNRPTKQFIEVIDIRRTPAFNDDLTLVQCDVDGVDDGLGIFNLSEVEDQFENPIETYKFGYYISMDDALMEENEIDPQGFVSVIPNQIVFLRVFSDPNCYEIFELKLVVNGMTDAGDVLITVCDLNTSNTDQISLSGVKEILEIRYPQTDFSFYAKEENAILETNEFTADTYTLTDTSTVQLYFRGEKNNECSLIGGLLFNLDGSVTIDDQEVYLCSDGTAVLKVPGAFNEYTWSTGENSQTIVVDEVGVYDIEVSNGPGCTDTATITVSEAPQIEFEVTVNDFQQSNTLTINAVSEISPLEYSTDGGVTFQDRPVFNNVLPGYVDIIVSDAIQCATVYQRVLVRGAPRYFTPNNDGFNDFWHVDMSRMYQDLEVVIFDRFGKVLSRLTNQSEGWDGTFNGNPLPTGAYWFKVSLEGQVYAGHFALIRR